MFGGNFSRKTVWPSADILPIKTSLRTFRQSARKVLFETLLFYGYKLRGKFRASEYSQLTLGTFSWKNIHFSHSRQYFRLYWNNRCALYSCLYKGSLSDALPLVFAGISESLHFRFAFAEEVVTGVVIASKKQTALSAFVNAHVVVYIVHVWIRCSLSFNTRVIRSFSYE